MGSFLCFNLPNPTIFQSAVNHFQRLAAKEVFRSAGMVPVFPKAPLQVGGDTGIQRAVVAADDVDRPVHADRVC